jgi:hypothetical protein
MSILDKTHRNQLETIIQNARDTAEKAATISLQQYAVDKTTYHQHLTKNERTLRVQLRTHARQQGDTRNSDGTHTIDNLVEKIAYEHWHRMLFARFLAENNLLIHPTLNVPISLTECEDLAPGEGAKNGWELAARYASRMLPQIFRQDSPVLSLEFSPEFQQELESLVAVLPSETFTASDSLGWVYQYWQTKRKDEVNKSEVKIGAMELPAVTQLFTEPYMVNFLLDNSLGAWWASQRLTATDYSSAVSEEELRTRASLPGVSLQYMRFVKEEDVWVPAGGSFDDWPEDLSEFKLLDPCCGSGHFLVAALEMLVPIRMTREGLSARDVVDAILRENIYGLEIDPRCVEIAAFALALAAWRYPEAGGYRQLPELNIACSGMAPSGKRSDWVALGGRDANLRMVLGGLFDQFGDAPVIGSLIDPGRGVGTGSLVDVDWGEVYPLLVEALGGESDFERVEMGVVAQGLARAAVVLAGKYHLVTTNVPYLSKRKQIDLLRGYCEKNYPEGKNDLATVFLERCLELCNETGVSSIVLPQNWLFLTSYRKLRVKLLNNNTWNIVARLGSGAFETISGEVVQAILLSIRKGKHRSEELRIYGLNVSEYNNASEKNEGLRSSELSSVYQIEQLKNPDARIIDKQLENSTLLFSHAESIQGLATSDDPQFVLYFWELNTISNGWEPFKGTVNNSIFYGGLEKIIHWENGKGRYYKHAMALKKEGRLGGWKSGSKAWGKKGISIRQIGNLPCSLYSSTLYDHNSATIIPNDVSNLAAIWCFCSSPDYYLQVRKIDQKLMVTNSTLVKVPFDLDHWTKVAQEKYPNGLPEPYSDDPTQWIFHGHPTQSVIWNEETKQTTHGPLRIDETVLQVAVARLLGYQWPTETDPSIELCDKVREIVESTKALQQYADKDGIVCITPVRGELNAEDRLENLLAAAYGDQWNPSIKSRLLASVDHADRTLESWLRDKYFKQHCKLFMNRPFIWHIWDGLNDGFSALVNYHKLDRNLLERLIYTYLGDWITRQLQEQRNGVDGAGERFAAAEGLKRRLELILEGETPLDVFVRWKPLGEQSVGWGPDLDDGVRLNIRPFLSVETVKRKGAGVLRERVNVHWKKDRGRDVVSAPWYKLGLEYGGKLGDRINDHHLTLKEKKSNSFTP